MSPPEADLAALRLDTGYALRSGTGEVATGAQDTAVDANGVGMLSERWATLRQDVR